MDVDDEDITIPHKHLDFVIALCPVVHPQLRIQTMLAEAQVDKAVIEGMHTAQLKFFGSTEAMEAAAKSLVQQIYNAPTLCLFAQKDTNVPDKMVQEFMDHGKLKYVRCKTLPDCGHEISYKPHATTLEEIRKYIS